MDVVTLFSGAIMRVALKMLLMDYGIQIWSATLMLIWIRAKTIAITLQEVDYLPHNFTL